MSFEDAGVYSLYQKVLVALSITPSALSSLTMRSGLSSRRNASTTLVRNVIFMSGIFLSFVFIFFGKEILEVLGNSEVTISSRILGLVVVTGLVGTLTNPTLIAAVKGKELQARLMATVICTPVGLITTWGLSPIFGFGVSFATSLLSSSLVYFCIKFVQRRNTLDKG
jgi:O-antigen/teichoic acid export membrane protein